MSIAVTVEVAYGAYITTLLPIIMEPTEDDGALMCYSYLC